MGFPQRRFHRRTFLISDGLKFETNASQVQPFCLHVTHSDVVDTLVMHMKRPFNGYMVKKRKKKLKKTKNKKGETGQIRFCVSFVPVLVLEVSSFD